MLSMNGRSTGTLNAEQQRAEQAAQHRGEKAAPNARPASPRRAIGWPSRTVAADPTVPGTPNNTAGIVSEVTVTAASPIRSANAVKWSMRK